MSTTSDLDRKANRLINEKSPYLLQHAHNPVDWYPWGKEAFEKANSKDIPIFLSIGYSTCHWCHVMERESFESSEIASLLNEDFVCIKVDREERPDIDYIYMQVCQTLTGSGGWPLTVIMTPDRQPFYAATYLPPHDRGGLAGLDSLLPQIAELWKSDRQAAVNAGREISSWIKKVSAPRSGIQLSSKVFSLAVRHFQQIYDSSYGGFGKAPKFPTPHNLLFLLKYYELYQDDKALEIVERTLTQMYRGGIYDHVGFGFARYSTDREWLVPHFEKMLYDNALLSISYLEAYRLTGNDLYRRVVEEVFAYVLRDMTSPEGGFYSAEDADSEGEEGKFYTWTPAEVMEILGSGGADYCKNYDISEAGNFEGRNIPNLIHNPEGINQRIELETERQKLFASRKKRVKPLKDDKILTAWNGLMIAAMATGYRLLQNEKYLLAAERAADFILQKLRREDGRLLARYRDGESLHLAYATDYAYLIWGLLELYEAGAKERYLQAAQDLNHDFLKLFWDKENGGLFFYGEDSEELLVRPKEFYDGALPSDNAVASLNFLRLARKYGHTELEERAQGEFQLAAASINENPMAYSFWLLAALYREHAVHKIVL